MSQADKTDLSRRRVIASLAGALPMAGCGAVGRWLSEPPAWFHSGAPRPPVVFVHGAFGARLRRRQDGREVWPVGTAELLLDDYYQLALPLDPETGAALDDGIEAAGLFDAIGTVDFYGPLVGMLQEAGGYRLTRPGQPPEGDAPSLYLFLYDWRRDLVRAAQDLAGFIEQVAGSSGRPGQRVDLVVHSSGGTVARHYLLHGARSLESAVAQGPDFSGAARVERLVAIGVPELGMARSFQALVEGEPLGLGTVAPETLMTAESPYQLLPHGDDAWLLDERGQPLAADSCDPDLWRDFGLGIFNDAIRARVRAQAQGRTAGQERVLILERAFLGRLDRARQFRSAIRSAPLPAELACFTIGGECRPTLARLMLERVAGQWHARATPDSVRWRQAGLDYEQLMLEPGDGTVTRASAAGRPDWPQSAGAEALCSGPRESTFVCASHNQLVGDLDCQRALLRALDRLPQAQTD
jgi:pimeloyl-ACP methyl ester carboxylesterase